jgi:hypothetical protein
VKINRISAEKNSMKGGMTMNYEKPEVVVLGPASDCIQSTNIKGLGVLETHAPFKFTNGAYLADE